MADFSDYPDFTTTQLLHRLALVATELRGTYAEYGHVQAEEKRAKIRGFLSSEATTVTQREREGDVEALEASCEALRLKGDLEAQKVELRLLESILAQPRP